MRTRMAWPLALIVLAAAAFATWSLIHGQDPAPQPPRPAPAPAPPAAGQPPASPAAAAPSTALIPGEKTSPPRDLSRLTPLQQQMYFGAQRGADWLFRLNRT